MTIHLNPEQELLIGQAIHAGLIRAPDDVVGMGIETIKQRLQTRQAELQTGEKLNAEEWASELHDWVRGHSATAPLLPDEAIDRDAIYGSRGQ